MRTANRGHRVVHKKRTICKGRWPSPAGLLGDVNPEWETIREDVRSDQLSLALRISRPLGVPER